MKKGKFVFAVRVKTRNLYADIFQSIRNMLGMNLISYENMITEAIQDAVEELYEKYPNVDPTSMRIISSNASAGAGAAEIIVTGVVFDD
jgi:uncharacterized protein YbjQ (UPF0145 family)